MNAGPQGTLFGSVTATDIADEIWKQLKVRVDRRKIDLEDSIKRVGRYQIPIEVFTDVSADVKIMVVPEGGELPPEEELEAMAARLPTTRRSDRPAPYPGPAALTATCIGHPFGGVRRVCGHIFPPRFAPESAEGGRARPARTFGYRHRAVRVVKRRRADGGREHRDLQRYAENSCPR